MDEKVKEHAFIVSVNKVKEVWQRVSVNNVPTPLVKLLEKYKQNSSDYTLIYLPNKRVSEIV